MSAPMQLDLIVPGEHDIEIVDPDTGEQVALTDASSETIAAVLRVIQERLADLSQKKRWLGGVLIERMDKEGLWTVRGARVKVTAPSAVEERVTWDAELLHEILDQAVMDELISKEAALRACSTKVEHVTHAAGIKALEKLPAMAARIAPARRSEPAPERNVRVSVTS